MSIALAVPELGEAEALAAGKTILSGWVTQGPRVGEMEQAFRALCGAEHACACSNCTTALHMALLAVGVGPGDVVVTVSHSFIATANAIRQCGADPVFVDIDPDTFNMSPAALRACLENDFSLQDSVLRYRHTERLLLSPESPLLSQKGPLGRLGAILVVHQVGMPADLGQLLPLAREAGVPVVEDAACATGSLILHNGEWQPIGRPHGDAACFSFHPRKVITTGDGGMVTTASAEYDRLFRLKRQHGMSVSDTVRHNSSNVVVEEYLTTGFNYRMTDIQAAVGIEQLKRLPTIIARRREIAGLYGEALSTVAGLTLPKEPAYAKTNWQSYVVRLAEASWQRPVMQALLQQGISTRRGVMCAHREPPYRDAWSTAALVESERAQDEGLVLPLHTRMDDNDVLAVATALKETLHGM